MPRLYLLFRSTHETLKAEGLLQAAGLPCRVVQKPPSIRVECGLALRTDPGLREEALAALQAANLPPRATFAL
ncbi:MAG: DUF3343 domain-containing protein [Bacillota bacterium]